MTKLQTRIIEVKDKTPDMALIHIKSREKLIGMLDKGIKALEKNKPVKNPLSFKVTDDAVQQMIDLIARNTYISHVEQRLLELKSLASMPVETEEERKNRIAKDSVR